MTHAKGLDHENAIDRVLARIILGASLGAAVGLALAALEIARQGYLGLGYWRSIQILLRSQATLWALFGVGASSILCAVGAVLCRLGGASLSSLWLRVLASPGPTLRYAVVVAAAGWGLATLSAGSLAEPDEAAIVAICAATLFGVLRSGARAISAGLVTPPLRRLHCSHITPLVALAVIAAPSPFLANAPPSAANPRNLVLIGIDTLRLDHTSLFRDDERGRTLTPNLLELARAGASFRNATSQAPWTLPAFSSMMTGRYPFQHGAVSYVGALRAGELTLAELLREAGYFTAAVVSHFFVDAYRGFYQGFEVFDQSNIRPHDAITSQDITDAAIRILADGEREPFFLFVHYFDPHYTYVDHLQWRFADAYDGWVSADSPGIEELRERSGELGDQDLVYLRDLYDEEVAHTDREIGRLLRFLDRIAAREDTAVIVVSDHGEEFMERGWIGHTVTLHEELIRVPLVARLPDATPAGTVVATPVETRALFATVLDYLGVPAPTAVLRDSLLPLLAGGDDDPDEAPVFSSVWLPDAPADSGKRVGISSIRQGAEDPSALQPEAGSRRTGRSERRGGSSHAQPSRGPRRLAKKHAVRRRGSSKARARRGARAQTEGSGLPLNSSRESDDYIQPSGSSSSLWASLRCTSTWSRS